MNLCPECDEVDGGDDHLTTHRHSTERGRGKYQCVDYPANERDARKAKVADLEQPAQHRDLCGDPPRSIRQRESDYEEGIRQDAECKSQAGEDQAGLWVRLRRMVDLIPILLFGLIIASGPH